MVQAEKQDKEVEECRKNFARRALGFAKRTAGLLKHAVVLRKRRRKADCPGGAKTAQEVRDHLQNRCPWWGP